MSMNEVVKKLSQAIDKQADKAKTTAYDTPATVRRIEGDTAWVHIPGGVDETPVKMTISAKEGDSVQVRVSGGNAFMVGNGTNPPTDDARANEAYAVAGDAIDSATMARTAALTAEASAASAQSAAASAQANAAIAKATTDEINNYADSVSKTVTQVLADGETAGAAAQAATEAADSALYGLSTVEDVVGVLNWITAHGTMTLTSDVAVNPAHVYFVVDAGGDYVVGGTHYSIVSEPKDAELSTYYELTVDESVQNYVATHIVVDTEGLWIVPDSGGNKVLIATGAGSTYTTAGTYIVGAGNVTLASFTASGAQIGQTANGHTRSVISSSGMQITQRDSGGTDVDIANLGYGPGNDGQGQIVNAPYYSLGSRTGSIGNYSTAEGNGITASGANAHAEGYQTVASGPNSHAEGLSTISSGSHSHAEGAQSEASSGTAHAEGRATTASAASAHSEGLESVASGIQSHAQNTYTIAQRKSQTAIGEYNVADTTGADGTVRGDYALIIGNGTADNARSNALTVDWNGNVEAAGDVTDGSSNTLSGVASSLSSVQTIQNTYAELYGISSNLTLSTTAKKVPLNGFSGHNCTLSSNGIKVPAAGTYLIAGSAYCTTGYTISDIVHIDIYKNSSSLCGCTRRMYNANPYEIVAVGPLIVTLAANDVIYLYAYNQTGARGVIGTNTLTHLTLHRIV